jgi:hypothetical protein
MWRRQPETRKAVMASFALFHPSEKLYALRDFPKVQEVAHPQRALISNFCLQERKVNTFYAVEKLAGGSPGPREVKSGARIAVTHLPSPQNE